MQCYVHAQHQAVGACVGCGKFICPVCLVEISGKNYCKTCVTEIMSHKDKEIDKLENRAAAPTVFMNAGGASSSSSHDAPGMYGRYVPPYPTQSVVVHILLLLFTCGLGNIAYFLYVRGHQKRWEAMYG